MALKGIESPALNVRPFIGAVMVALGGVSTWMIIGSETLVEVASEPRGGR